MLIEPLESRLLCSETPTGVSVIVPKGLGHGVIVVCDLPATNVGVAFGVSENGGALQFRYDGGKWAHWNSVYQTSTKIVWMDWSAKLHKGDVFVYQVGFAADGSPEISWAAPVTASR